MHRLTVPGLIALLLSAPHALHAAWRQCDLTEGWSLRSLEPCDRLDAAALAAAESQTSGDWLDAPALPAMVHDILVHHGRIEAPWKPGAAAACRWVAQRDWLYACTFTTADPQTPARLTFAGLDTLVDVYLNGTHLATHTDMYRPLHVDVTGRLRARNRLVLHVHTVFDPQGDPNTPRPPVRRRFAGRLVRRPGQNYGNYLGPWPYFSRVGVYGPVSLEQHEGTYAADLTVGAALDAGLTRGTVTVDLHGVTDRPATTCHVTLRDPDGRIRATLNTDTPAHDGGFHATGRLAVDLAAEDLWWPRGYGRPVLHTVTVELLVDGHVHQRLERRVGFRRVTQSQPLHFAVNGVPVRLWGGCWVTPRWDTAVWDPERARRLLDMAEHAHFNAFRIWGVVESPPDAFYEQADARGFLLWQDFTDLPLAADDASRRICREEAAALIRRLRHHPSVLLWCGGNEQAMWHHPEFNRDLTDRGPWPGRVATEDLAALCQRLDPERPFWPNSPDGGDNPNAPEQGDTHGYTNLWFVSNYTLLNFASEDTRIAAPVLHSLRRFMAPEDLWPRDYDPLFTPGTVYPFPSTWRKYTTGTSWRKTGPIEQFYDANGPAELVYRLGMAAARYYRDTVEPQRRGRTAADPPATRRCGGYLVWKYNDSWPQVYSGKVDYFLEPTHTYYALRRAYAPILLSFEVGSTITLWLTNDTPRPLTGTVTLRLFHIGRNTDRHTWRGPITAAPGRSVPVVRLDDIDLHTFRLEHLLGATLTDETGAVLARAHRLVDIERRVAFPPAHLDVRPRDDGSLVITTDRYARAVTLTGDAHGDPFGWFFSDNAFDLLPGEEHVVRVLGDHRAGTITVRPHYSPHATTLSWTRP